MNYGPQSACEAGRVVRVATPDIAFDKWGGETAL